MAAQRISIHPLRCAIDAQEGKLNDPPLQRPKLQAELSRAGAEIVAVSGSPTPRKKGRSGRSKAAKKRRPAKAARSGVAASSREARLRRRVSAKSPGESLVRVLGGKRQTTQAESICNAVLAAGYKARRRDFYRMVSATLRDAANIKELKRGVYAPRYTSRPKAPGRSGRCETSHSRRRNMPAGPARGIAPADELAGRPSGRTRAKPLERGGRTCMIHANVARRRGEFVDYLAWLALRVVQMCVYLAGVRLSYRFARLIGELLYRFDRRHRERAVRHLALSFPDWSEQRCRRVARASMRSTIYLGVEVLWTTRLITPVRWRRHVRLVRMEAALRRLVQRRSGLIFLTGHFGNWEIVGYTMATLGFGVYAPARALPNPYINAHMVNIRRRAGLAILDKFGAAAQMEPLLKNRQVVGFIADQSGGPRGCFVDFFGRKASAYRSVGLLATRHHVPIVIGYGRRLGEDFRFEIGVARTILPREWADKDDPVAWITREYTRALEQIVRSAPEQYLWTYRRWKDRPRGEQPGPDGVA